MWLHYDICLWLQRSQGGFPLSRNFYVRTDVNSNWLNLAQLVRFTRGFSYITSILIYARKASSSLRPYARKNYATVEIHLEGGRKLQLALRTQIKIEVMYEKPRVNVKVEPRSTFTFTRGFSYITSIPIYARKAS